MAEQKRGPVKPPTLDLKANDVKANDAKAKPAPEATRPGAGDAPAPASAKPGEKGKAAMPASGTPGPSESGRAGEQISGGQIPGGQGAKNSAKNSASGPATSNERPQTKTERPQTKTPEEASPRPQKPQTSRRATAETGKDRSAASEWGAILFAAILGGAIGVGGAYGLAQFGYWPQMPSQPNPDLATQSALKSLGAQFDERTTALENSTNAQLSRLEESQKGLGESVKSLSAKLENAPDVAQLSDRLAGLEAEITGLKQQIAQLPQTGSTTQAPAQAAALNSLQTELDGIKSTLAALGDEVKTVQGQAGETASVLKAQQNAFGQFKSATETSLATLEQNVSAARAQLPVALNEMAGAIQSGEPFADALALVRKALPQLAVPADVAQGAADGLADPIALQRQFERSIPAVLAAAPANPAASWQDRLVAKLSGMLALRPAEPASGNSPEALVSQLEGALAKRDFGRVLSSFSQMPQPMQKASGLEPAQLQGLAEAQTFLAQARQAALSAQTRGAQ